MKKIGKVQRANKQHYSIQERLHYWIDNHISHNSLRFIRILIIASVIVALIIAALIILFRFHGEDGSGSVMWNSIATVINAEFPYAEDGSIGYIIMMAIASIIGVLFTSVLIGIITSAIEEKITDLKKGKSRVLENNHFVILGFVPGEFELLKQLILAAEGNEDRIVIAAKMEQEAIEESINEGLEVPDNIRIICRTADITDPNSLEKLSIGNCRSVIINPTDDMTTIKALLAVSTLIRKEDYKNISVNAIISSNDYQFPPSIAEQNNITALQTNNTIARIIAHSCTQSRISELFEELFNYEGSEMYLLDFPNSEGLSFYELSMRIDKGVPVGMSKGKEILMNPPAEAILGKGEKVLVFAENKTTASLTDRSFEPFTGCASSPESDVPETEEGKTVVFGSNESLHILIWELPENISSLTLVNVHEGSLGKRRAEKAAAKRNLTLEYYEGDPDQEDILQDIARTAGHIVLLNDHTKKVDEADMEVIFLLLHFRDLRNRFKFNYNITAEMRSERNERLVANDDNTDFIVASNLSSLFLAQLAESPELISVFREILSNEGNEVYLKNPARFGIKGTLSVQELRKRMLEQRAVLIGYLRCGATHFNPPLDQMVEITSDTRLFVISEN